MKTNWMLAGIALAVLGSLPAAAQIAARPSDKTVVGYIDGVQKSVKQFERSLDSKLKRGTIRGTSTEVNVENYLKDFSIDIDRLRKRFKSNYSASAELATVLEKAEGIRRYVESQPATFKGRSEWDVVAAALNDLSGAYGTAFPLAEGASPRRINDAEISQAADQIVKNASSYRKALKGAFTKEESAARASAEKGSDAVSNAAKALKSRIKSGKPASGEAAALAEALAAAEATVAGRTLPENATAAWAGVTGAAAKIAQGFGG